jgi:hypothetical protein
MLLTFLGGTAPQHPSHAKTETFLSPLSSLNCGPIAGPKRTIARYIEPLIFGSIL